MNAMESQGTLVQYIKQTICSSLKVRMLHWKLTLGKRNLLLPLPLSLAHSLYSLLPSPPFPPSSSVPSSLLSPLSCPIPVFSPMCFVCSCCVYLVRFIISCCVCIIMLGGGAAIFFTVRTLQSGRHKEHVI